jgi:hypothetical protein
MNSKENDRYTKWSTLQAFFATSVNFLKMYSSVISFSTNLNVKNIYVWDVSKKLENKIAVLIIEMKITFYEQV